MTVTGTPRKWRLKRQGKNSSRSWSYGLPFPFTEKQVVTRWAVTYLSVWGNLPPGSASHEALPLPRQAIRLSSFQTCDALELIQNEANSKCFSVPCMPLWQFLQQINAQPCRCKLRQIFSIEVLCEPSSSNRPNWPNCPSSQASFVGVEG